MQIAGLCHAAYGTDGFAPSLLDLAERPALVDLIGEPAEALVYFSAGCDRRFTYPRLGTEQRPVFRDRFTGAEFDPGEAELRALLAVTAANEFDVFEQDAELERQHAAAFQRLSARVAGLLPPESL